MEIFESVRILFTVGICFACIGFGLSMVPRIVDKLRYIDDNIKKGNDIDDDVNTDIDDNVRSDSVFPFGYFAIIVLILIWLMLWF